MRILDRFLNQLPTVTIREGHRLKVYLTADLICRVPDPGALTRPQRSLTGEQRGVLMKKTILVARAPDRRWP